jgi:hypothetical protein
MRDGTKVGHAVTPSCGLTVGANVGHAVSDGRGSVGNADGAQEGRSVGTAVGSREGLKVGARVRSDANHPCCIDKHDFSTH